MKAYVNWCHYHGEFFLEWEFFQTESGDKIKTYILGSVTFCFCFSKIVPFNEIMWKNEV